MNKNNMPNWDEVGLIIFDFDGIFTNNKVFVNNSGEEYVCCSRADGLAFDILRKFINLNKWNLKYLILSKEENSVVSCRAKKLSIPCFHGIDDKLTFIKEYIKNENLILNSISNKFIYLGNDLNDLSSIEMSDFSIAPKDAHPIILKSVDLVLPFEGGDGFVRNFIERLLQIDQMSKKNIMQML